MLYRLVVLVVPGAVSFDGSSIHYFMRPVSQYDLPTLSSFDDQQVYPLVPRSSLFSLAAISLAIHFWKSYFVCCLPVILF